MTYLQPLSIADINQNLMMTINIEVGRMRRGKAQLNTQFFIPEIRKAIMSQKKSAEKTKEEGKTGGIKILVCDSQENKGNI